MKDKNVAYPKVVLKKVIHASRERVFEAWTKPELMQQWMVPGSWTAETTNQLRVGGSYSHEMISDGTSTTCDADDKTIEAASSRHPHYGEYLEISPPERLVFTWNSEIVKNSRVTIDLRDLGDSTEVCVTHELLDTDELRRRHSGGWESCLINLSTFLG